MSATWIVVVVVGVLTWAIKAAGPVVLGGRTLRARPMRLADHLAPALLAALVAVGTLGADRRLVVDERLLGLAAAAVALALRAPVLLVVVVAAATTAVARAL